MQYKQDEKDEKEEHKINNENISEDFPRKQIYKYLDDIQLREKIINENLNFITLSRQTIEQFLNAWENNQIIK